MPNLRDRLTVSAGDALHYGRHVAGIYHGSEMVQPHHLLEGVLHLEDCTAVLILARLGVDLTELVRVLEQEVRPVPREWPRDAPALEHVLQLAVDEAQADGATRAGTLHLLLALLRYGEGRGAELLRERDVTYSRVQEAAARLRAELDAGTTPPPPAGDRSGDPRPVVVSLLAWFTGVGGIAGLGCCVPLFMGLGEFSSNGLLLLALAYLWSVACAGALAFGLGDGRQWAWSGTCSLLLVKLGMLGTLAAVLATRVAVGRLPAGAGLSLLAIFLHLVAGCAALLIGLFRAGYWFGVRPRARWRTMWRQGWWVLVGTAGLDLGWLLSNLAQ